MYIVCNYRAVHLCMHVHGMGPVDQPGHLDLGTLITAHNKAHRELLSLMHSEDALTQNTDNNKKNNNLHRTFIWLYQPNKFGLCF